MIPRRAARTWRADAGASLYGPRLCGRLARVFVRTRAPLRAAFRFCTDAGPLRVRTWARGLHLARSALFAVCFRWGLRAFLFRSSHVEILSSHDARSTAVAHLPPARLGGVSSLDPLGPAASRLAPLPLRQPPLLPAPPLLVSCLAAPLAPGHQSSCESLALHTLTTQQLRRESVKVKILLCRPSRHSSCVVRV